MTIKQVKLAQALPGSSSHLLEKADYDLTFDKGILTARHKRNRKFGTFMVFPANIAYILLEDKDIENKEVITESASQEEDKELTTGKGKKAKA